MKKLLVGLAIVALTLAGMNCVAKADAKYKFLAQGPVCKTEAHVKKVWEMWENGVKDWPLTSAVVNMDGDNCTLYTTFLVKVARTDFLGVVVIKGTTYYSYRAYVVGYKWRNSTMGFSFNEELVQYFFDRNPLDPKDKAEPA